MTRFNNFAPLVLFGLVSITLSEAASIKAESAAPGHSGEHIKAPFDILETSIVRSEDGVIFGMRVRGEAGEDKPTPTGDLHGSTINAYAWLTTLDSADVGFPADQGITTLAITYHPDFDDEEGVETRDRWHAHWLVLEKDETCDAGYKVNDMPLEGNEAILPVMMSNPALPVGVEGDRIEVVVPAANLPNIAGTNFDGATMRLEVAAAGAEPALCATMLYDTASDDLSLPGEAE